MKGYRTITMNVIATVGSIVALHLGIDTTDDVATLKEGADSMLVTIPVIWGVVAVWFRSFTTTPIGEQA